MRRLTVLLLFSLSAWPAGGADSRLVVHEWGTFTCLQDDAGDAVRGINVDDEPVPSFVHRLAWQLVFDAKTVPGLRQGAPAAHPHVTMRLETPVIYFHLPPGEEERTIDVDVSFRSGWVTEYYPDADSAARGPGGERLAVSPFGPLEKNVVGTIRWPELRIGTDGEGPETDAHVWLAPRAVDAATVTAASGESERYLFYRGVAHRDAPIRIVRDDDRDVLWLMPEVAAIDEIGPFHVAESWLVHVREDGATAFRTLPPIDGAKKAPGETEIQGIATASSFAEIEYAAANLEILRGTMHDALVAEGLFQDEATAMLRTWELSYFKSPGLRLLFLVPRAWTDHVLPLRLSEPATVVRVMVGRIELVTPRQRELLRRIAAGPSGRPAGPPPKHEQVLGVPLPAPVDYDLFLELGRFRHALLLREQQERPTAALDRFMEAYRIRYYEPSRH